VNHPDGQGPAWYPDPSGRFEFRYHNGTSWTADVASGGVRTVDHAGVSASADRWVRGGSRPPEHRDRLATASLVLGIVGICLAWVPVLFVAGAVCAVLAIVFALVARRRRPRDTRGFIGAGLATGGGALPLVAVGVWTSSLVLDAIERFENPPPADVEITECSIGARDTVTVAGTITNEGDDDSRFRVVLLVPSRLNQRREVSINVGEVRAGQSVEFHRELDVPGATAGSPGDGCPVVDITGPFPFGVEIDSLD
jgi:hypothetical protein